MEDKEAISLALQHYFSRHGFAVTVTRDLAGAKAALAAAFSIVVADLRLTGTDSIEGLELAQYVQAHHSGTPVVLLTAYRTETLDRRARTAGVDTVLQKPIPLAELAAIVGQLLDEGPGNRAGNNYRNI